MKTVYLKQWFYIMKIILLSLKIRVYLIMGIFHKALERFWIFLGHGILIERKCRYHFPWRCVMFIHICIWRSIIKIPCDKNLIFPSYISIQYFFPSEVFLYKVFFTTNKILSLLVGCGLHFSDSVATSI